MKNFINIQGHHIRKTSINKNSIVLYFSNSRYKVESVIFTFDSVQERDETLQLLDNQL